MRSTRLLALALGAVLAAVLAVVLAVVLLGPSVAAPSVALAATAPTHTPTPAPTATPYPTYTPYPSATHVPPSPSPTPSPSLTPAATIGGAVTSDTTCGATGLHIPLPLGHGICIDVWGVIQRGWASAWGGFISILETKIKTFTDAIMGPLVKTDNPTGNAGLVKVKDTLATDAAYGFAVVFGVAVLWVTRPTWFGNVAEGVALLWRSGLVLAALHAYDLLVNLWLGAVNGLAGDIGAGASTMHDLGHSGLTLVLAPVLLLIVGIERAVSLHVFAFVYEIGPLAIILFAWPPAADIARAWLRAFAYLSLLGPAYALMLQVIASLQKPVLVSNLAGVVWDDVMLLGGLLVLALVPGILAGLLSAASHAGAGGLDKIIALGAKAVAL